MERIAEWVRERPWLIAIPIVGVIIYLLARRQAAEPVYIPVTAGTGTEEVPQMPTGVDLSGMADILAAQTAAMQEMFSQQAALTSALTEEVRRVQVELPATVSESMREYETKATKTTGFSPVTETIKWWYGGETVGEKTVTARKPEEQAILEAKQAYWEAQARGDVSGMEAAHQEAEKMRAKAKKAGVELAEWAMSSGR